MKCCTDKPSKMDLNFIIIVKDWLCTFTKRIEFEKDSIIKLKSQLKVCEDSRQVSTSLASFTRNYLACSFETRLHKKNLDITNI